MSQPNARSLLAEAAGEAAQVRRHLLVAAALSESLHEPPVVVGGTAQEFWTEDEYRPTDLDLCAPLNAHDEERLGALGFRGDGRHWVTDAIPTVAIEFPDSVIDGDPARVQVVDLGAGRALVIGLDDLYLDRLRQATANPSEGSTEFHSALAVAVARYEDLDRGYLAGRLRAIVRDEPQAGAEMIRLDRLLQRRARRSLS